MQSDKSKIQTTTGEFAWFNEYFRIQLQQPLSHDDINTIAAFSLLWNTFERLVCNNNASVPSIVEAVDKLQLQCEFKREDFVTPFIYFKNRYVQSSETNYLFETLEFRRNDRKELVRKVLLQDEPNANELIYALLRVVYRLRNNMFRGIKSPFKLNEQIPNFQNANLILMRFLELWDEAGMRTY